MVERSILKVMYMCSEVYDVAYLWQRLVCLARRDLYMQIYLYKADPQNVVSSIMHLHC